MRMRWCWQEATSAMAHWLTHCVAFRLAQWPSTTCRDKPRPCPLSLQEGITTPAEHSQTLMEQRCEPKPLPLWWVVYWWQNWQFIQTYIVTGGRNDITSKDIASTEILKKVAGTSWQTAASLPSARHCIRGVSLDDRFIVAGEHNCQTAKWKSEKLPNKKPSVIKSVLYPISSEV